MPDRPGAGQEAGGPDAHPTPGTPRWVKVFVLVLAGLILLGVLVALLTGGRHGPGRHLGMPAAAADRGQVHLAEHAATPANTARA